MKLSCIFLIAFLSTVGCMANQGRMGAPSSHGMHDSGQVKSGPFTSTYPQSHNTGTLKDFPRLHPLIVHFPIIFLILALIFQVCSFWIFKWELSWLTLILIVGGFIGSYLASNIFHGGDPNLQLLDTITRNTFEKHELFARYTVWISGIAALVKIISHFFLKRNAVSEIFLTLLLVGSAYTICVTGDMGARLVYIDGVGIQGNKIPEHDSD
jgi:uncharacterized membrane protein